MSFFKKKLIGLFTFPLSCESFYILDTRTLSDTWIASILSHAMDYQFFFLSCCSVAQSCPTLCNPPDCSMAVFPVLHSLLEFAQTHIHWVDDAIQPSHPLSPLLLLPLIFPRIRVFSNESSLFPASEFFSMSHSKCSVLIYFLMEFIV